MKIAAHVFQLPPAQIFFIFRAVNNDVISAALAFVHTRQPVKIRSGKAVYRLIFKFFRKMRANPFFIKFHI